MEPHLSLAEKFDIQQNYRRYVRLRERLEQTLEQYKDARASRVWIAGIVTLLFALASDFFLGTAAGLFGVYFYGVIRQWMRSNEAKEGIEQLDRWFHRKGLRFEGRILYARNDQMLEHPLDPFDDGCYR
ncbi:hypothetical protein [Marinobacterium arenosum]|uniref:hypothetical protein n=1 Tax=Marinobacterium arenosum TaxID=2862496 RepID=UPI001C963735|nr:hypothetical protein [Marinobacterium arenosum]MBY4677987.1 hypothetical protein [Marinobacterium arenosum]